MARQIKLPTGQIGEFPDDMSDQNIESVLKKQFPSAEKKSTLQKAGELTEQYFNKPFEKNVVNPAISAIGGFEQGLANMIPGAGNLLAKGANLLGGDFPTESKGFHNFVPEQFRSPIGESVGEVASYFLPGNALSKIASKGSEHLSMIPQIAHYMNQAKNIFGKAAPTLSKIGAGASQNALLGATLNPEHQGLSALLGAGFGGGGAALPGLLSKGLEEGKKIVQQYLPILNARFTKAGQEGFPYLKPGQVIPRAEAGLRLGTPLTPAEASGHPYIGAKEGALGRVGEAAAERAELGIANIGKQRKAVNKLLDTIYDKTPKSANKIKSLYVQSYQSNLNPTQVNALKKDPIINKAFNNVKHDEAWQRDLQGVSKNNYQYLDKVRSDILDGEKRLLRTGDKQKSAEYTKARQSLTRIMDSKNPTYAEARAEAQKAIIRDKIQKKLKKTSIRGMDFYKNILQNPHEFNKLYKSLKNVPEAQQQLSDMRLAWEHLINIQTPRSAAGKAEMNTAAARDAVTRVIDIYHEIMGTKSQKAALKYIHSDKWVNDLMKIHAQSKNKTQVANKLSDMIGRLTSAGTITGEKGMKEEQEK